MKSHDASSYKKTTFYLKPEGTLRVRNQLGTGREKGQQNKKMDNIINFFNSTIKVRGAVVKKMLGFYQVKPNIFGGIEDRISS